MGKPNWVKPNYLSRKRRTRTRGSKTFQYPEENKLISIPLVAASETGEAQTEPYFLIWGLRFNLFSRFKVEP